MAKIQKLELTWAGKNARSHPEPRILMEDKSRAYGDPDSTNMLIHGDNLLALKSLEADFAGQVKCIYIDPPYNTGNAFEHYDDGYEHSIWLSLMRDRLEILRDLLSDDGSIWIQIDDNEQAYLKVLCDEIFGRQNFISTIAIKMSTVSGVKTAHKEKTIIKEKEFVLVYAKNSSALRFKPQYIPKEDWNAEFQYYLEKNGSSDSDDWSVRNLKDVLKENGIELGSGDFNKFIAQNADKIWRRAFIRNEYKELSQNNPDKIFYVNKGEDNEHYYYRGREMYFLKDQYHECFTEDGIINATSYLLGDIWSDINTGKLFNEGGVEFRNSKKPEFLVGRILDMVTNPGDLVLDSFLGSGTTAAVAHKMGRRWIGIELGDHAYTHCQTRLQKVVDGTDTGGISKAVNWTGGGGFKFYELATSLLVKDEMGNLVIAKEYNADMLAEAMCKLMGYKYAPDKNTFWKQGKGTENNYIFTTTMVMTAPYLEEIARTLGNDSLMICCSAFIGDASAFPNITTKRIPKAVLDKCEWNKPGYPLPVRDDFVDEDFEFGDDE